MPFSAGSLGKDTMIFEPILCLKSSANFATSGSYLAYHQESGSYPQFADHFVHFAGINRDDRISTENPLHLHRLVRSQPSKADRKFVSSLPSVSDFLRISANLIEICFQAVFTGISMDSRIFFSAIPLSSLFETIM